MTGWRRFSLSTEWRSTAAFQQASELLALPGNPVSGKIRVLSILPGNAGSQIALRVTFDGYSSNVANDFHLLEGQSMWVAAPIEYCENSGQDVPPAGGCGAAPGMPSLSFFESTLQCDPAYLDWSTFGTIHLFHEFIVPQADYSVQAIDETCDRADEADYSDALLVTMNIWGDVGGPYNAAESEWEAPDGRVDITVDVTAVLDKFRNLATAPTKARAEIEPSVIDMVINISDVTFVLNAFRGSPYPFAPSMTNPCP